MCWLCSLVRHKFYSTRQSTATHIIIIVPYQLIHNKKMYKITHLYINASQLVGYIPLVAIHSQSDRLVTEFSK